MTYAAVGRFMSAWEELEVALSHLHGALVGRPYEAEALWDYGIGSIFRERLRNLVDAASKGLTRN